MSTFVSKDVQTALDNASIAGMKKASRLQVRVGGTTHPILRLWTKGFSVEANEKAPLRGLIDLYDGTRHLAQCLIVASEEDRGIMRYEFKRMTAAHDAPPLDFYRAPDSPVALLAKS